MRSTSGWTAAVLSLGIVTLCGLGQPAAADDCCQLKGSCDDMPPYTSTECVNDGGQITYGPCNGNTGLCAGTTVCCDTSCDDPTPSCQNMPAGDCSDNPMNRPVQGAVCDSSGTCQHDTCSTPQTCDAGTSLCPGTGCVNFNNDPNNCGGCGKKCPAFNVCDNGGCTIVTCQAPGVDVAVPPPSNAGGPCAADVDCPPNQWCAGGTCADKKPDVAICGAPDQCASNCCCAGEFGGLQSPAPSCADPFECNYFGGKCINP